MSLLLIAVLSIVSMAMAENVCPQGTYAIDNGFCLDLKPLTHDEDLKFYKDSFNRTDDWCINQLKTGGLNWSLPKINTEERRKRIEEELINFTQKFPPRHSKLITPPWIWLGMRRSQPLTNHGEMTSDESDWYWTRDKSVVSLRRFSMHFWQRNQPDNDMGYENCAIARVFDGQFKQHAIEGKKLLFASSRCEFEQPDENMIAVACMAELKRVKEEIPLTKKWWFLILISAMIILPIIAVVVVLVIYFKRRNRNSSGRTSEESPRHRRRKKQRKDKKREQSSTSQASITMKSDSETPSTYSRVKVGYNPPPAFLESSTKTAVAIEEDDEGYCNVLPSMATSMQVSMHGHSHSV